MHRPKVFLVAFQDLQEKVRSNEKWLRISSNIGTEFTTQLIRQFCSKLPRPIYRRVVGDPLSLNVPLFPPGFVPQSRWAPSEGYRHFLYHQWAILTSVVRLRLYVSAIIQDFVCSLFLPRIFAFSSTLSASHLNREILKSRSTAYCFHFSHTKRDRASYRNCLISKKCEVSFNLGNSEFSNNDESSETFSNYLTYSYGYYLFRYIVYVYKLCNSVRKRNWKTMVNYWVTTYFLSGVFLLFDILGSVGGDQWSRINDNFTVFEYHLPLDPCLDLPRRSDLFLLSRLPFLCKPKVNILLAHLTLLSLRKRCFSRRLARAHTSF